MASLPRLVAGLIAALTVLTLTACGGPSAGTIQDKRHSDGFWYTTTQCVNRICTPTQHYSPPSWAFDLYAGDEHGWHGVSELTYDQYAVGDYYPEQDGR